MWTIAGAHDSTDFATIGAMIGAMIAATIGHNVRLHLVSIELDYVSYSTVNHFYVTTDA